MEQNIKNSIQSAASRSPKNSFLVLISCLVIVLASTFLVYSIIQSRQTGGNKSNVAQNSTTDKVTNNQATNQPVTITDNTANSQTTSSDSQIPSDWKEYKLSSCGIKIVLPPDWVATNSLSDKSVSFNASSSLAERERAAKDGIIWEGYQDLAINCYDSLKELTDQSWTSIQMSHPDFSDPKDLYDVLTRKSPLTTDNPEISVLMTYNIKSINYSGKTGYQALQGGFGESINSYFQKGNKVIVFIADVTQYSKENKEKVLIEPQKTTIETFGWL